MLRTMVTAWNSAYLKSSKSDSRLLLPFITLLGAVKGFIRDKRVAGNGFAAYTSATPTCMLFVSPPLFLSNPTPLWQPDLIPVSNLFVCAVWIGLSGLVIYKTNFFKQLWENPEVNQFFLTVTLMAIGFQIALLAYLTLYGPLVLKRDLDMERDMPNMIPVMTIAGTVIFFGIVAAMWPVWGFLTPIFMIILFFGTSLSTMFLPSGTLGNFCFWVLAVGGGYIAHNLDHEPEW